MAEEEEEEEGKHHHNSGRSIDKSDQTGSPAALHDLINGRLSSSLRNLASQSRTIPSGKDFHFYNNFEEFRDPSRAFDKKSRDLLTRVGSVGRRGAGVVPDDLDDAYDWLVSVNDDAVEKIGEAMDEFLAAGKGLRARGAEGVGSVAGVMENGGFQIVRGKNERRRAMANGSANHAAAVEGVGGVRVATRDKKVDSAKAKVSFHLPNITRPQDEFGIRVNNANQPFEHVWLQRSEDGSRFVHPMEKLSVGDFIDKNIGENTPVKPLPLEETPFKFVEGVKELKELASKLRVVNEFAIDLEHNSYRSFQGLTCLMQISTRTEDFVVDTLKLRVHIGPYLREVFKDPSKRKVMHGADHDILWFQRDFGIYVCNLFDTGQASRVLQLERNSLEYLLSHYCNVAANKEYQNAEWRLRPLPAEMIKYAREDTHYLLYLYDMMCQELLSVSRDSENESALMEVYRRSCDICLQLYEKELLTDTSYLYIYGLREADFSPQQLAVASALCDWRDNAARGEDESTGFILPNRTLLEIARQMPESTSRLRRLIKSKHPIVERYLGSVVIIIKTSIRNAHSFETVSEELKRARLERLAELNSQTVQEESRTPQTAMAPVSRFTPTPNTDGTSGHLSNTTSTSLLDYGSSARPFDTSPMSGNGHNMGNESSPSLNTNKVTVASIQVLKKPNGAFGAMLGNSKKKVNPVLKKKSMDQEKTEEKLQQIKASVCRPFHSFSENPEPPPIKQPILSEKNPPPPELQQQHNTDIVMDTSSNLDDIIPLKSDESETDAADEQKQPSPPSLETLNLSSTCHKNSASSLSAQAKTSPDPFEPFDYEAARKEMNLEEELAAENKNHDGNNMNGKRLKGGSKKSKQKGVMGKGFQEESADFEMPKRRQAFPASGNRSATFRD